MLTCSASHTARSATHSTKLVAASHSYRQSAAVFVPQKVLAEDAKSRRQSLITSRHTVTERSWKVQTQHPLKRARLYSTAAGPSKDLKETSLATQLSREQQLPRFQVDAQNVTLLEQPKAFYAHLLTLISRAKRRIVLASLYVGKSEHGLMDALADALARNSELKVVIIADSLRSTREGPYNGEASTESCASLLAGLKERFPERVHVCMYRAPGLPTWLEKLVGKRFVEGWGLQHMKIYGADDEIVISGANLSNDYFTNRRDRYISIKDRRLSDYLYTLAMTTARYSFALKVVDGQAQHNEKGKGKARQHAPYQLVWDNGSELPVSLDSKALKVAAKHWKSSMRNDIEHFTAKWHKDAETPVAKEDAVEIVPILQMGPLSIAQETTLVPKVIAAANRRQGSRLDFTTGYFSINPIYAQGILQGSFRCNLITASPQANGFYGSKGVSKYLPAAYTWLTQGFWRALVARGRNQDVTINEWNKEGWTYHAKGIWLYAPGASNPYASLLGSSNFGTRSAKLDLECTLLIDASRSPTLQRRLGEEVRELARDATDKVDDSLFQRPERVVPLGVQIAARIVKRML